MGDALYRAPHTSTKVAEHIHLPLIYGILQNASFCSAPVFLYVLERLSLLGPR